MAYERGTANPRFLQKSVAISLSATLLKSLQGFAAPQASVMPQKG
jgi:hypothetical protein